MAATAAATPVPTPPQPPRRALRSVAATLGVDEAKAAIFANGFYCKGWNDTGHGIAHAYEARLLGTAVVVVDQATGLMWQKFGRTDRYADNSRQGAEAYVAGLNESGFAGFRDWRLPTLEEAMSLMTDDAHGQAISIVEPGPTGEEHGELVPGPERKMPAILHIEPIFAKGFNVLMWTADFRAAASGTGAHDDRVRSGWLVDFLDGAVRTEDLVHDAFVRAVRTL
jgi:hypothetical protein